MQQVQHARGSSFLPKLTFVITLGLITAATGFKASAVDVFTDPVGFITLNAVGNGLSFDALGRERFWGFTNCTPTMPPPSPLLVMIQARSRRLKPTRSIRTGR